MKVFEDIQEWREFRKTQLFTGKTLGFVPTMGNLHAGHCSLLRRSAKENALTVLSVFVNPTQFNEKKDYEKYPRTLEEDINTARQEGVDYVLMPKKQSLYPKNYRYRVCESKFSEILEGKFRPGHFDGMLTVVLKLLLITGANRAYFGEKDFQQSQLILDMVSSFFIDTQIIVCPTLREKDGLAMSSRNKLLTKTQRKKAGYIFPVLKNSTSNKQAISKLSHLGFVVDYVEEHEGRRLAALRLGDIRLIDNIVLN